MKKSRFPLIMADGVETRSLEDLREHFDLKSVLEYYKNGKLLTWLQDRYLEEEAEALQTLDEQALDFQAKLCGILGVAYTGEIADMEAIAYKQERLVKLRTFTDEAEYIEHVDQVAFDQEELADLLDDEVKEIYLCGKSFSVPSSQKGITYIGVNSPSVHISGKLPESADGLGIEFSGCEVDNLPIPESLSKGNSSKTLVNDSSDRHAEKITGEVVDWLVNIAFDNFHSRLYKKFKVHETPNYIHYGDILLDKHTMGVCRVAITTGSSHDSIPCYYGDSAIYFKEDTAAHDADAGNVWRCDFSALNPAEKLFPMKGWRNTRRSICGNYLVFNDSESGLNIYDIEKKSTKKIPLANEGRCGSYVQAIFAAAKGVYYSYYDCPTYSVNFYKYGADSSQCIFKASEQIEKIYYVREDGKMLVEFGYKTGISLLDFSDAQKDAVLEPIKTFDVWLPQSTYAEAQIVPYHDCLVYTAKRGIIKSIDYKTFEAAEIIDGAAKDGKPGEFCRIGDWIVYDENGNADKTYRVSLMHPGEKYYMGEFDAEKTKELRKSIPERESPTSTNKKPEETSSVQKNILEKAIGELKNYWFLYS